MTTFADDFNRADSSNLGAGWVEVSGDWSIASNQLSPGNLGGTILLRAATPAATDDNFTQVTIAATTAASQGVGCRGDANFQNGYLWRNDGSSWNLFSVVGGSFSSIASYAAAAAPGDVAKVQAVGSTIKAYVNGVERASVTDTGVPIGKNAFIRSESTSSLRYDNFSSGDVTAGADVDATIAFTGGGLTAGVTATREVPATAALTGGGLAAAVTATRDVPATLTATLGGLSASVMATRETTATAAFTGGGLVAHLTASTGGELKHANATVIARAWLAQLPGIPVDGNGRPQVATTLPDVEKWAATGFITVGPIFPGSPERYVPLQHPVVQVDCWAVYRNSKTPDFGTANELAEVIRAAADLTMVEPPPEITLPPQVRPVWLSHTEVIRGVTRVPDELYAHYSLDLHIGWIERDALAGVVV